MTGRRLAPGPLVLATHNAGKVRELDLLVAPHGIEAVSAGELGLAEPAETGSTFVANAALKARAAAGAAGMVALADDSGLAVDAIGGKPGVWTADWAGTPRDWMHAMRRVEAELAARPGAPRTAAFHCALVLAWPDGHAQAYEGRVAGVLAWPPRGSRGFGFDPMFVPDGHEQTFGELDPALKHAISHRAVAWAKLAAECL